MYAILVNKNVVPVNDVRVWGKWFETSDRIVKQESLKNGLWVSTVFLGLDHSFGAKKGLYFETMVFDKDKGLGEQDMDRYTTYEEAEEGHKRMVKKWSKKK